MLIQPHTQGPDLVFTLMKVLVLGILRIYGIMQPQGVLGGDHRLAMPNVLLSSLTRFRYVQVGTAGTKGPSALDRNGQDNQKLQK